MEVSLQPDQEIGPAPRTPEELEVDLHAIQIRRNLSGECLQKTRIEPLNVEVKPVVEVIHRSGLGPHHLTDAEDWRLGKVVLCDDRDGRFWSEDVFVDPSPKLRRKIEEAADSEVDGDASDQLARDLLSTL